MTRYLITLNGEAREIEADGEMPLLWALRDRFGLMGTKYGCGEGLCGACTVHMDGGAVRSCVVTVADASGRRVITIEGLSGAIAERLRDSWIAFDVPQCGYCQTGQIMSAAALLAEKPSPTDQEIEGAVNGNLCRCGTYQRIRRAIRRAAQGG